MIHSSIRRKQKFSAIVVPHCLFNHSEDCFAFNPVVKTRSGRAVVHSEGSYGRAAKKEITRQRLKRKLESTILRQVEEGDMNTTPRRQTRDQIWEMEELFTTPPSVLAQVTIIPPDNTTEHFLRGRIPSWSDFGIAHQFLIRGHDSKC